MIEVSKALKIIKEKTPRIKTERRAPDQAVGSILAVDIKADMDLPPFDRSQMDGFAVRSADLERPPATLRIVGESAAGSRSTSSIKNGEAVRIMTGAALPGGADAVVKMELTSDAHSFKDSRASSVEFFETIRTGTAIVMRGEEIQNGKVVFEAGDMITPGMVAPLAAFGYSKVRVGKRPRVAILGTGSEIVEIDRRPGRGQIRNSNSAALAALCRSCNAEPEILPLVRDDIDQLKNAIRNAGRRCDLLIITGGVSVGKYDHTGTALAELRSEIFFDKVSLKPGKPTVFARLGTSRVFGLPGNPVSAAATFHLFVRTALLTMQGAKTTELPSGFAVLTSPANAAKERETFLPATITVGSDAVLCATPLNWKGSSDLVGFSRAQAFIILCKGQKADAGDVVPIVLI